MSVERCLLALCCPFAFIACNGSQAQAPVSPPPADIVCGSGTVQSGDVCIPSPRDAGPLGCGDGTILFEHECVPAASTAVTITPGDAGFVENDPAGITVVGQPVGEDAGTSDEAGSQATTVGIDAAHRNTQSFDAIASPLTPAWTLRFNGRPHYPLIAHGLAIVQVDEPQPNLRAVDLATGKLVWGPISSSQFDIAYDRDAVFGVTETALTAFDALTGATLWTTLLPPLFDVLTPPVASEGVIYFNAAGGSDVAGTYAFDERDGKLLWRVPAVSVSLGTVAVAGGVVYSAEVCRTVLALDARSGNIDFALLGQCLGGGGAAPSIYGDAIWERDLIEGNAVVGFRGDVRAQFASAVLPAFHEHTAFLLGRSQQNQTTVSAMDIATNLIKWSFAGDGHLCTSPAVAGGGGQVFVGSSSGNLYELDEGTGAVRSVSQAGAAILCGSETMSMAMGEGHLLVPADNALVAY
jgi:outer membrane protein assembly factor BamB